MYAISIILCIFMALSIGETAKILGVFPFAAHSHYTLGIRLMTELANRGHEITFINPYPSKVPIKNIKDVSVAGNIEPLNELKKELQDVGEMSVFANFRWITKMGIISAEKTYECQSVKDLINSNETFDLILIEDFLSEAYFGFSNYFNAPIVLLSPIGTPLTNRYLVANPTPSSYIPNILSSFGSDMNIMERFQNLIYNTYQDYYFFTHVIPKYSSIMKKALPNSRNLEELIYNTSLILVNDHPSINGAVPHVPAMIEIGGYHVSPPKALPKDIKLFLDNAKEGVIYFSMGSNLKSADLPEGLRNIFLTSFSKIKQKVLWKFEQELPDLPKNVKIMPWCPQQDILAHQNVKAFISHGGLLSIIETVYHGVPIIGIPVFGDQKINVASAAKKGYAINVPLQEINAEKFYWALNEIINNPEYRKNVKQRSAIMHDQPLKPIDSAMYWIEYVIRHKGATHLRVAGLNIHWYQRELFDIAAILLSALVVTIATFYKIIKYILSLKNGKKSNLILKSKKNK